MNTELISLIAIAKDQDNYLKEQVNYNLKIGFDNIFIYQNNWRYTNGDINSPHVHTMVCDGQRMQTNVLRYNRLEGVL